MPPSTPKTPQQKKKKGKDTPKTPGRYKQYSRNPAVKKFVAEAWTKDIVGHNVPSQFGKQLLKKTPAQIIDLLRNRPGIPIDLDLDHKDCHDYIADLKYRLKQKVIPTCKDAQQTQLNNGLKRIKKMSRRAPPFPPGKP